MTDFLPAFTVFGCMTMSQLLQICQLRIHNAKSPIAPHPTDTLLNWDLVAIEATHYHTLEISLRWSHLKLLSTITSKLPHQVMYSEMLLWIRWLLQVAIWMSVEAVWSVSSDLSCQQCILSKDLPVPWYFLFVSQ